MSCSPGLWWSSGHSCVLGLTLLLLLSEVITSRLCNSLVNMVDGFHTLFILLHLSFFYLPPSQPDTVSSHTPSLSSSPSSPNGASLRSPTIVSPSSSMSPNMASPLFSPAPGSAPTVPATPTLSPPPPPLFLPYGWARVRPLGAMISALLLASLCISFSVDIMSQILWPHPTQHPLLISVVGAVGLLVKTLVLIMNHRGLPGLTVGSTCPVAPTKRTLFTGPSGQGEARAGDSSATGNNKDQLCSPSFSTAVGMTPQDDAFMFCNPGTSSVLSPDCDSMGNSPPSLGTIPGGHIFVSQSHVKMGTMDSMINSSPCCEGQQDCGLKDSDAGVAAAGNERPMLTRWCHCSPGLIAVAQALMGSVLVLVYGLALLLSEPGCLHSMVGCEQLVYLDPGFSALATLVYLATTLPQAWHYGYLLLLGTPPNLSLDELSQCIASIPGVLDVHELHLWQLTETQLVASVHIHCSLGLGAQACSDLLLGVSEVLQGVGVSFSSVQPEFLPDNLACLGNTPPTGLPQSPTAPHCSLACGQECALKMCCLERKERPRLLPSAGIFENVQPQGLVIENTYL